MTDESVRIVVLGSILMGISCGLIGSYVVSRRLSLFGDTLSHAVLPGIAIGFVWAGEKNNLSLLVGASVAGFLGVCCIGLLNKSTKIKEDSSLGIVLSAFYAVGICLLTRIQKSGMSEQSGLESYMFGQASALSYGDLEILSIALLLVGAFVFANYKELLVTGFDPEFSKSIKLPAELLQYCLWALIAFCVISSLQLVGVVLVSALLVIPAATASLLAQRYAGYLALACLLGAASGLGGSFLSFLGNNLPTGPLIVLSSTSLFLLILFCRPKNGLIIRWLNFRSTKKRIARENLLKAAFQILEAKEFDPTEITIEEMMNKRRATNAMVRSDFEDLIHAEFATASIIEESKQDLPGQTRITLTPQGWEYACRIVRNHRLWELYLTNEAQYEPDHVHEDAEKIEHVLGEETVRQIERLLKNPRTDPHGKLIPSLDDVRQGSIPTTPFLGPTKMR